MIASGKLSGIGLLALVVGLSGAMASVAAAGIALVQQGKSDYSILVPDQPERSVSHAAAELQLDIRLATGATLPIRSDGQAVQGHFISLGQTSQAKAVGLEIQSLADGAFHILTRDGNLYIIGRDTPRGGWTRDNGFSRGTANGVYTFLEKRLDVRWLMPGKIGRDVPENKTFAIDDIDRVQTPIFMRRILSGLNGWASREQREPISAWKEHVRLGGLTKFTAEPNWHKVFNPSMFKQHPDWFPMKNGKRVAPEGKKWKIETTNPEVIQYFAQQAIKRMKANPRPQAFSISPSDGSGWSESPQSKAWYDAPRQPGDHHIYSSLVFKWYHDVASIIAREYPQGRLSGFIYDGYINPPTKVQVRFPDNVTPVIAMSMDYGYKLYNPKNRQRFREVMDGWTRVAPKTWFYYDLPNLFEVQYPPDVGHSHMPGSAGLVSPAAPDILNFVFPMLLKDGLDGTLIYGNPAWSNAAMSNYVVAKMEWNPKLDAEKVQAEWLSRAYGPAAGATMNAFYHKLDGWVSDCYQTDIAHSYHMSLGMLKFIYAPGHYAQMEQLLLKAQSQVQTPVQRRRLQLITDNMIVLQWRLRNAGFMPEDFSSKLQRNDKQVIALLQTSFEAFPLVPGVLDSRKHPTVKPEGYPWKTVRWSDRAPRQAAGSDIPQLQQNTFMVYARQDRMLHIQVKQAVQGAYFATYEIHDSANQLKTSGLLIPGETIAYPLKAGEPCYLYLPNRKPVQYKLLISSAARAEGVLEDRTLILSGSSAPIQVFYVPTDSPIGLIEQDGSVIIRKPYSGESAKAALRRGGKYQDVRVLHSFDDGWRFSPDPKNDGIARGVLNANFDDSQWKTLSALNWWTMQGFADYYGPAWYRMAFTAPKPAAGQVARLYFGAVDGNTVVYLNGKKVGDHHLGKDFKGWDRPFFIDVTDAIQAGNNILAVQVTSKDTTGASGIFKGVCLLTARRE